MCTCETHHSHTRALIVRHCEIGTVQHAHATRLSDPQPTPVRRVGLSDDRFC